MKKKLIELLKNPLLIFFTLAHYGCFNWMDDELYLKISYFIRIKKRLRLNPPVTFNEKLHWLKLHDHNPLYTTLVDKQAVKQYVADKIGKGYIIPTLCVWEKAEDIDFNKLPDQFVLKCTHDSGSVIVCKNKKTFDFDKARQKMAHYLKFNFFAASREWPYKNVPARVIAEKYMEDMAQGSLVDYKFYVFNGEPKFLYVSQGLENHATAHISFMNMDWTFAPFHRTDYAPLEHLPHKPTHFKEMCDLSKILAKDISFVRVDFYEVKGQIYFSEMTFFPCSGCTFFDPPEWDQKIGNWLILPDTTNQKNIL